MVWYEGSGTATWRWLHADERGSIVAISDDSGALFAINRYDEHGTPGATNTGRFQFTGQAWVGEVNLYYFKARFYAPSIGRFMQTDPSGYAGGLNLYAYVRGDAINGRDPTGLEGEIITVLGDGCTFFNSCESFAPGDLGLQNLYVADLEDFEAQTLAEIQRALSQKQQNTDPLCGNGMSFEFRAQQGIYANVLRARLSKYLSLHGALDLLSYNTPLEGDTYLSHGIDLNFSVGRYKFGFSFQQRSYNGGLSWQSDPTNFNFWDFSASSDGIDYEFSLPQAGSGFTATLKNVDAGIPMSKCMGQPGAAR